MSHRSPALDGLRGIAILLVLLAHAHVAASADWPSLLVVVAQGGGWLGVDLFFVLSGFLITGILIRSRGADGFFRNFYARRALRIWPLYYLTIVFAFVVAPHLQLLDVVAMQQSTVAWLFFLQNVVMAVQQPPTTSFDNLWSIAVEEQFYLVLPLTVMLVSPRRLPWLLLGAALVGLLCRIILDSIGTPPLALFRLMPTRLDSFAVGGLLSIGLSSRSWRPRLIRAAVPVAWLTAFVLLIIGVLEYGLDPYQPLTRTWGYTIVALFFGALLVLGVTSERIGGWFSTRWLRLFGKYSYAIYLLHYPLWGFVEPILPSPTLFGSRLPAQLLACLVMGIFALAIGWLCWNLVERHLLSLKRYFPTEPSSERRLLLQIVPASAT